MLKKFGPILNIRTCILHHGVLNRGRVYNRILWYMFYIRGNCKPALYHLDLYLFKHIVDNYYDIIGARRNNAQCTLKR